MLNHKNLTVLALSGLSALSSVVAYAQPPATHAAPPAIHGSKMAPGSKAPASKNPDGITWNAKANRFQNAKGKFVSKEVAHAAGVKGPAMTPKGTKAPAKMGDKMGKMMGKMGDKMGAKPPVK